MKIISILSLVASVLGIALSFSPIGQIAYLPAIIGLLVGLFLFMKDKSNNIAKFATLLAIVALAITASKEFTDDKQVTNDNVIEQKAEESEKEAQKDLEELDGLE